MAFPIKKLRKLQRNPKMFVRDLVIKKLGGDPGASSNEPVSYSFVPSDFEIVDGLVVLNKPDLMHELGRLKDRNANTKITMSWRR